MNTANKEKIKVFVMGASTTMPYGLPEDSKCWVDILAKKFKNWEITNFSKSAAARTTIVDTVINNINKFDVFIVAFSTAKIIEFSKRRFPETVWFTANNDHPFYTNDQVYQNLRSLFFSNFYNLLFEIEKYIHSVILLESFLKHHNKKYLFCTGFSHFRDVGGNFTQFKEYSKKYIDIKNVSNAEIHDLWLKFKNLISLIDKDYFFNFPYGIQSADSSYERIGPEDPDHLSQNGHYQLAEDVFNFICSKSNLYQFETL